MKKLPINAGWLAAILALGSLISVQASVTDTNADSSAALNQGSSWVGGVVAGSANVAVWDSTVQANLSKSLGASASWLGVKELNPGGLITINADGNTLTLGASGIDLSLATNSLTMGEPMVLGANQSWVVTNGQVLTLSGAVSGSGILTINNGGNNLGTVIMQVANSYSGGTVINSGVAEPYVVTSFGSGEITNNGGCMLLNNFTHAGVMTNAFYVTGTSLIDMANENQSFVFDGPWNGSGTIIVTNDTGSGSTLTFGGANGGNMANFTGSIIITTNASGTAPAGTLRFNNGGSQVNTGNAGMAINLGATNSTMVLANRDAGTTSVGELTGGFGTTVTGQTSGNGTEVWSVGGRNTSVTFGGAFVNRGSAALTALTKVGTGTYTLTGTNTFTGAVTISAGALQIGDGGADGVLGGGAIANNATLIFNRSDNYLTIGNNISGSGSMIIQAGGTITYTGADTSSGLTFISQGDLILSGSSTMTGPISVGGGGTFDVSQLGSFSLVQTLSGDGSINGAVTAAAGSINPGGSGTNGTLTFLTSLTESGNVNNQFVLSTPGGTNDLVYVNGPLTLSGTNNISLSAFNGGTIPVGVYPLFRYTGGLTGGTNNFLVTAVGVSGILTNITSTTPPEIAVIIAPTARGATNLFWKGDGVANNWDLASSNWYNGATSFNFLAGDKVVFNNAGSPNTNVTIALAVQPASVLVSNTAPYLFEGPGSINGATGLTKTNSGSLSVFTTNYYTGPTVIGGGALVANNLANGGSPSSIGAATSNPTNLVFYGSTLVYDGPSTSTDHGATFNGAGGTFDVTNGVDLTWNGVLTGPGALTLVDFGTLTLANVNTYAGGTLLAGGVLALGSDNANNNGTGGSALGSTNDPVTFNGGALKLYGSGQSTANNYNNFFNTLIVPAGQTGTLYMFPRGPINTGGGSGLACTLTGGGTLNLVVNYVRDALSGNWSAFTGTINVTDANPSDGTPADNEFRINNNNGYANATVNLNGTLLMDNAVTTGGTINIGSLGSISTAVIGKGNESAGATTWSVGWLNTTNTFSGEIQDDSNNSGNTSITKVGTGIWYLAGQNTYSGSTTVSNGVLALTYNPTNGTDGAISSSTNIFINGGAALDLSGTLTVNDTLYLNSLQVICGYGTLRGALDTTGGGTVTGGGGLDGEVGVLTVTNFVNLGGTTLMKLDRLNSPNSDRLVSSTAGTIYFGGTLVLTNIGPDLRAGDTFTLFSAPNLVNSFSSIVLPNYYTWNTSNLGVNGQVSVTGVSAPPSISSADYSQLANGIITLSSTNGLPNGTVYVLSTTNLALPFDRWTQAAVGNYDGNGNLSIAVTVNPSAPQSFFLLQSE